MRLYTIGHSTWRFRDFLHLLREVGIALVVDVRRFPTSRKFPHYNGEALRMLLRAEGVGYVWMEALGGRRHGRPREDSPNTALKAGGFRNYADYMMTPAFRQAVEKLTSLAARSTTAVMCAERFYWKCHRRLLADYLAARGVEVLHILGPGQVRPHRMTPTAAVGEDGTVLYAAARSSGPRGEP